MQKAMSFNDVAIVYVKGSAYRIHFWYMSKDDAISIMNNSNLIDEKGVFEFFFFLYIKTSEETYYQKKQRCDTKHYYKNDKKRLREQARGKYRNLFEEEKNKREYMEETDIIICLKKRNKD